MKVILKEKINKLGNLGQIVNVKSGYARNYLIPQDKALLASKNNITEFKIHRSNLEEISNKKLDNAKRNSEELKKLKFIIEAKSGEGGKLFGSIGRRDISEIIFEQSGININTNDIRLNKSFRQIGDYNIEVHLHNDIKLKIQIQIIKNKK